MTVFCSPKDDTLEREMLVDSFAKQKSNLQERKRSNKILPQDGSRCGEERPGGMGWEGKPTGGGVVEPYINSTIHAPQKDWEKV